MPPIDPDTRLLRSELAAALTESGYDISPATLAGYGSRGGGPPYDIFGGRARYRWGSALGWAEGRVTAPRRRTDRDMRPRQAA